MLARLIRRGSSRDAEERSTWSLGQMASPFGWAPASSTGVSVTTSKALQHPAVWACAHRIARDVSRLPWDVVEYDDGARVPVATPQIVAAPSVTVPASGWRYQAIMSMVLRGNAWGLVTESVNQFRNPTRIELLHPDAVQIQRQGGLRFFVDNNEEKLFPAGRLWHVPAWLMPGDPIGLSVIEYHREAIASGLAVQAYAGEFFGGGGHPSAILSAKTAIDEDQARGIKAAWRRATTGTREPAVMGADLEYKPIQATPEDAQYVESQRWSSEEVCRVFGVPSELVGIASSGSSVTYANREDRALDYVTFTLADWLTRLEEALTSALPGEQVVKANEKALLRMNARTQAEVHEIGVRNGWRSINEVRAMNDEAPVEGGDAYAIPGPQFGEPNAPD